MHCIFTTMLTNTNWTFSFSNNNNDSRVEKNFSEASGLKPRVIETAFEDPTLPKVVINFQKFIKDFKITIILKTISDFPGWFGNTNFAFECIGLKNVISKLIEARIDGKLITYQPAEESVIKSVLSLSVDTEKFSTSGNSPAQDILYGIMESIGLIKTLKELTKFEVEFVIDIRDGMEANLKKWEIAEKTMV
ncbi:hypothetical protein CANINC_000998 [Pichia inconspicua]|uniref:Uncharacterized protein n=1 Tax=Pichia inconspicua TaxID=52247 RepID=A0A4T0X5V7_9ASCO|nr:hypothetical protein CANINC_000998 [[Candida] inconspicua]